jgi:hypothetical protein
MDELKQLGDEARTYAEAEIAYQKGRAIAVGKTVRNVAVLGVGAFVIAVFALVALVAGLLMALAHLVGPWWATAIVAGGLAFAAIVFVLAAKALWKRMMQRIFAKEDRA